MDCTENLYKELEVYKKYSILVTDSCNLSCKYCYQNYKAANHMEFPIFKKFIDQVFDRDINEHPYPFTVFDFIGGEPLLRPDFIGECIDYIKEKITEKGGYENFKPIKFTLETNGTLLGEKKVRALLEKHEIACRISIDGTKEAHDKLRSNSYDRIVPHIEWWKKNQKRPVILMAVSTENVDMLFEGFKHIVNDLGVRNIFISPIYDDKNWKEDFYAELMYKELIKIVDFICEPQNYNKIFCNLFQHEAYRYQNPNVSMCYSTFGVTTVDYTGKIYTCFRFKNPQIKKDYSIGDVDNWIDLQKMLPFINCTTAKAVGLEDCTTCEISSGCKKCLALNAESNENDDMYIPIVNICKLHHARVFAYAYLAKKGELLYGSEVNK